MSHFSSECDEPDTGSDFSPPLKRKFMEKPPSKIVISPASSSSVCVPDSESDSECGELSPVDNQLQVILADCKLISNPSLGRAKWRPKRSESSE